jgi:hypothetical protein
MNSNIILTTIWVLVLVAVAWQIVLSCSLLIVLRILRGDYSVTKLSVIYHSSPRTAKHAFLRLRYTQPPRRSAQNWRHNLQ